MMAEYLLDIEPWAHSVYLFLILYILFTVQ
jgi:hypothetical protein